jgi:soluble lytic murein transglycosylase
MLARRYRLQPDIDGSYLGTLVDAYDGSYVLALAAYNAGSTQTRSWLRNWGDPPRSEIDVIDWIELISVVESRNFVKRVIENLHVDRYRLGANDRVMYQSRSPGAHPSLVSGSLRSGAASYGRH